MISVVIHGKGQLDYTWEREKTASKRVRSARETGRPSATVQQESKAKSQSQKKIPAPSRKKPNKKKKKKKKKRKRRGKRKS